MEKGKVETEHHSVDAHPLEQMILVLAELTKQA